MVTALSCGSLCRKNSCGDPWLTVFASAAPTAQSKPASTRLPSTSLSPDPPNHADGGRLLCFAQHSIPVGEKRRLVREVPAPFIANQEALSKFVIESVRSCLQGLLETSE